MIWLNILILLCLNRAIKSDSSFIGNTLVDQCIELHGNNAPTNEFQLDDFVNLEGCNLPMVELNESLLNVTANSQPINLSCFNDRLTNMICEYDISRNHVNETIKILINNHTDVYQLVETQYKNISGKYHFEIKKSFNPFDQVKFRVSGNNSIGPAILQDIIFETHKIIKLPYTFPMSLKNLTSNKVTVIWQIPIINVMYEFTHFQYLNGSCLTGLNPAEQCNTPDRITFKSDIKLPYAYTNYTLTIRTFVKNAINWTEQHARRTIQFQSKKRIPDSPPQTIPDAFEYNVNNNDVIIYWKEIAANLKNGDNFCIKLKEIRSKGLLTNNINVTMSDTWAKLHNLNPGKVYNIKLIAENSEGRSKTFSTLTIPKKENLLLPPQNLKVLTNGSLYYLTWISHEPVDNFTIFVCQPQDEQKSLCQILVDYIQITGTKTKFIFDNTLKHPKIFAISSNLNGRSSGMEWFTCFSSARTEMAMIEDANVFPINGTSVKLNWTLPCEISPFLKAINILYCEMELYKTKVCETYIQHPMNLSTKVFVGLTPYTNYVLELSMFDGKKNGPIKQIPFQTLNGIPKIPTEIKYSNITNNTVQIYWTAPIKWNGMPQYYNISYANEFESHFNEINIIRDFTILTNLRSSTRYKIQLAACHSLCSAFSQEIVIKTKMGIPGIITNFQLDNPPIYEWSPPNITNGDFQVYEIKFDVSINGKIETTNSLMLQTKCTLGKYFCNYSASIRAINLDEQINIDAFAKKGSVKCLEEINVNYAELCSTYKCVPGNWEIVTDGKCIHTNFKIIILFYIIILLIIVGIVFVAIQKGYKRFKSITDIRVSIPMGLNLMFEPCRDKNPYILNRPISFDNISQSLTEELQNELELSDSIPFSFNGNYVEKHQDNMPESQH